jgi:hypothetical protein
MLKNSCRFSGLQIVLKKNLKILKIEGNKRKREKIVEIISLSHLMITKDTLKILKQIWQREKG